jgi:hypothetical protein
MSAFLEFLDAWIGDGRKEDQESIEKLKELKLECDKQETTFNEIGNHILTSRSPFLERSDSAKLYQSFSKFNLERYYASVLEAYRIHLYVLFDQRISRKGSR